MMDQHTNITAPAKPGEVNPNPVHQGDSVGPPGVRFNAILIEEANRSSPRNKGPGNETSTSMLPVVSSASRQTGRMG